MNEVEVLREERTPGLASLVSRALAKGEPGRLTRVLVPAPVVPAELLLTLHPGEDAFLFARGAIAAAGSGVARAFESSGRDRFAFMRDHVGRALAQVVTVAHASVSAVSSPRAFGGFAFSGEAEPSVAFDGFPPAAFVIPRMNYTRDADRAVLEVTVDPCVESSEALAAEIEDVLSRLATAPLFAPTLSPEVLEVRREPDLAAWTEGVEGALAAIRRGELEKVVLARMTQLTFGAPLEPRVVAARLATSDERTLRFALRRKGATFLGATPERLIAKTRDAFSADALAGSSSPQAVADLFQSKSTHEHAVVVRYIVERLAPLAAEILADVAPSVVRASHLRHLFTPIRGRARRGVHLCDLAAAIHPTPAVSGVPAEAARAAIARHEREPRGWYAGAIGFFDAEGDGELSVALRSGVLRGRTAHLFAGAGLVEGSRAEDEWGEIGQKERVMLRALGVEP